MKNIILFAILALGNFAHAVECDLNVSERQFRRVRQFQSSNRDFNLSHRSCNIELVKQRALSDCVNALGENAECIVAAEQRDGMTNPLYHVPIVGLFWNESVGTSCRAIVTGREYTRRPAREVKAEKCQRIEQCIETATLADTGDDVRILTNLRYNLNCQ